MRWFSWDQNRAEDTSNPSRENRQKCWETRDAYFVCLDGAQIVKPGEEGNSTCAQEKKAYYGNCAKSWVRFFLYKRYIHVVLIWESSID